MKQIYVGDIKIFIRCNIAYEGNAGKTKATGDHPACMGTVKCWVLHQEKHEVGYTRALTLSCIEATKAHIHHKETMSIPKPMYREWLRTFQWGEQADIMRLK